MLKKLTITRVRLTIKVTMQRASPLPSTPGSPEAGPYSTTTSQKSIQLLYISGKQLNTSQVRSREQERGLSSKGRAGIRDPLQFSIQERILYRNVQRFSGGPVCKAHALVYHSTLGVIVIKKKKENARASPRRSTTVRMPHGVDRASASKSALLRRQRIY